MREDSLPAEFVSLSGRVHYVRQRGRNEWSSSCPECGGEPHKGGEFPDRFRMWPVSKHGAPMGWCRHCNYIWTPKNERRPTREELEAWRLEQIRIETERKKAAERALELLQNQKLWERYYQQSTVQSRNIAREWGITQDWQDYLRIGFDPSFEVWRNGAVEYISPAMSIPVWSHDNRVQNIKMRVLNPKNDGDRYRNRYSTHESYLFAPLHELPLEGVGILFEGEKKAIVAEIMNPTSYRCIAVQSKRPDPAIFEQLAGLELVYLWPDPDAFKVETDRAGRKFRAVDYWINHIGPERVRVVQCPVKVDDGIVKYGLEMDRYIKMAVKP